MREKLPDTISLILGEHPRQLLLPLPDLRQTLFRSLEFYREIEAMSGVEIAHWNLRGPDLIEEACLVSTLTGSSAWEAMGMGVPGVVFGKTWYSDSEGCLHVTDSAELSSGIQNLLAMAPEEIVSGRDSARAFALAHGLPGFNYLTLPLTLTGDEMDTLADKFAGRFAELPQ